MEGPFCLKDDRGAMIGQLGVPAGKMKSGENASSTEEGTGPWGPTSSAGTGLSRSRLPLWYSLFLSQIYPNNDRKIGMRLYLD
jgi:hypothetical protein